MDNNDPYWERLTEEQKQRREDKRVADRLNKRCGICECRLFGTVAEAKGKLEHVCKEPDGSLDWLDVMVIIPWTKKESPK